MEDEKILLVDKGSERIYVTKNEFKGKTLVHIRVYFQNDSGEWTPTKKGVTFPIEKLDDIIEALEGIA